MKDQKIVKMIEQLPPELGQEVEDFVAFLSTRYIQKITADKIKFEWEGCLSEIGELYDAVEFQNTIMDWWEAGNVPY